MQGAILFCFCSGPPVIGNDHCVGTTTDSFLPDGIASLLGIDGAA